LSLARSLLEFAILTLSVTFIVTYGLRMLRGDFSPTVLIYIFSSLGIAVWLYKVRQQELRERIATDTHPAPHLGYAKTQHYGQKAEEKTRELEALCEKYKKRELNEEEYLVRKKELQDEIIELATLDDAVFEAKQTILRELARKTRIRPSRLRETIKNNVVLEEAIAELVEEGLLQQSSPDEYRYNYSGRIGL